MTGSVYGNGTGASHPGASPTDGNPNDNRVVVNSGYTVSVDVYGGSAFSISDSVTATGNTVSVSGTVGSRVFGGSAISNGGGSATSKDNVASVSGMVAFVSGGRAFSQSGSATATDNTVSVSGRVQGDVSGGEAVSYGGSATATYNTVTINDGAAFGPATVLSGGLASGGGDAFTGNILNLNSRTSIPTARNFEIINFGDIGTAGIATLNVSPLGAADQTKLVKLNTAGSDIAIAGQITGNTGGIEKTGTGILTLTGTGNNYGLGTTVSEGTLSIASDNNIGGGTNTLSGGTLQLTGTTYTKNWALGTGSNTIETPGDVTYGGALSGTGFTKTGAGKLTLSAANTFTGSLAVSTGTVKLDTSATLAASSLSLGADAVFDYSVANAYTSSSPGAFQTVTVGGLGARINAGTGRTADFTGGTLHFIIPKNAVAGDTLLNVDGTATVDGATVNLDTPDGRPSINMGDKLILIDATEGVDGAPATTTQTAGGDTYSVKVDGNELQAVLEALSPTSPVVPVDPGTPGAPGAPGGFSSLRLKAYAEGRAAGLAFVSQGLDFILNRGLGSAIAATEGPGLQVSAFGGTGGGDSRYRSGSHVDVRGMSFLAGLAVGNDTALGRATAAAFFEGGWGNYDSHNSFATAADVDGKGGTSYTGGGVLGRYDVTRGALAGLYLDASARMGRTKTDFRTDDIQYNGWKANFDSFSLYYGLHAGIGYTRTLTDKAALDLSAKVLWTRQKGDNVTVYRDDVRFEDADSLRTRLGGRFAYTVNDRVTPYAGAYWEHEFAGRLRSTVNGERLAPPSLRGDSGMAEVGFTYRPSGDRGLTVDIGVQGYVGKRGGASGSVRVGWAF